MVYYGPEDDPEKPLWALPDKRTIGSQVRRVTREGGARRRTAEGG